MTDRPPENLEEEGIRLTKGWLDVSDDMELDDYVKEHASPDYLCYYPETIDHLEEMERQGVMAG